MKVGSATLDSDLVRYLESQGFAWSDERGCFYMPHDKFQKWNNNPVEHLPMSFDVDAFHRILNAPYGGDCK